MLKVIINSYACCPNMGSEPGMGWNWIIHLAKYCELYVISEGEFREQCEEASKGLPIHWYWNPVTPEVRKMCWNQGDWRFYKYYEQWQRKTADIARGMIKEITANNQEGLSSHRGEGLGRGDVILHQLNMIGFREPGYLWQVSKETGVPFVWGPVDAKGSFPMAYVSEAPLKNRLFLYVKNYITHLQLKFSRRVRSAVEQADVLLSASSDSVRTLKKYFGVDSILMNETGCCANEHTVINNKETKSSTFDILWVGKFDFRKQLDLAIRIMCELKHMDVSLHVVGGGDSVKYQKLAQSLGVENKLVMHGLMSHSEVQAKMQNSAILLFTSVAEGTPHVVLEAIANGLPIVCFDTCGQGDCVNSSVGVKVPLTNPKQSVRDFADVITDLYNNREKLHEMSNNCIKRATELSWDNKARQVVDMYKEVVKRRNA